ncbi:MAG: hypothetical protein KAX38_07750 [Candidatus Krumholzibacteria bacterium]|nr:hypothetical protein [Candidatus Krumholzibacteria bacterium]
MWFRLLHYTLLKRKYVLWVTLGFFLVALLYVIFSDRKYETKALLLPPLEEGGEGLLTAWMAQLNLPSVVVPVTGGATSAAVLVDILWSRRLGEMIIESLGLVEKFEVDTMDDAINELQARTKISATKTGLIRLSVEDEDPRQAVIIARLYIEGLDSLNHYLQFTRAEQTMEFISGQIEKHRGQLRGIRENIVSFQQENGIINYGEQIKGAIDVAVDIKVRAIIAEIECDLLREFAREDEVELRRKEAEFLNLTLQLNRIMEGDTSDAVFVPLKRLPELYQRYATMQRDLAVNERVYSFLLERYEEAGIDKARTTPTVQVVDEPNLPEKPAGISRWAIVFLVTVVGFLWTGSVVAWWGWLSTKKRVEEEERAFGDVGEIIRQDLKRLRKLLRL